LRFDDVFFLIQFLPALLTVYFVVVEAYTFTGVSEAWSATGAALILALASAFVVAQAPYGWVLLLVVATAYLASRAAARLAAARNVVGADIIVASAIAVVVGAFVYIWWNIPGREFAFAGIAVVTCHAVTYLIDVAKRRAPAQPPLIAALYLLQFPVLPAGPIVRYDEFAPNHLRLQHLVGLGAFAYGTRRIAIGLVKLLLVAGTLGGPVDAIFALPAARLGTGAAWLAAVCFALQIYYLFSGYADLAIGIGRMLGLRYPENFRRPYVAESVREFWTRWHVTALTWLRDYMSLPIAGRDQPAPRAFLNIFLGFVFLGVWFGATGNLLLWALYSVFWLALEAIGFGAVVHRFPRALRHVYLLAVMLLGWVILRSDDAGSAWRFLQALGGVQTRTAYPVSGFLTPGVASALIVAVVGAGPMVPWISRWRVTLDATTTAAVMMVGAVWVLLRRAMNVAIRMTRQF
jgi:alginate O-acetyltransferase complex protein AlgI